MFRHWFFIFPVIVSACSTSPIGTLQPNSPPETYTVIDTIIRTGADRFESEVKIQWWGNDEDGYIKGYEFTFDDPPTDGSFWQYTPSQDSTFLLSTPPGQDTLDFRFSVRAIDNQDIKDPSPASVFYPVKNSPPTIKFIEGVNNPVKTFPALKLFWEGDDPDGFVNLDRYELWWNDTTGIPVTLDVNATSAIFQAIDPQAPTPEAQIFVNSNELPESQTISGMKTNAWNNLYIRAIDQSEAKSAFVRSDSIYIKRVNSNVLLVDAYSSGTGDPITDFFADNLIANGVSVFDTIQIFETGADGNTQQSSDNLTQARVFDFFDMIFWYGNNAESSLSLAQRTTGDFFGEGGKLFMSVYVSSSFDQQSDFLDFTPIASLVNPVDTTLILDNSASITALQPDWPDLQATSIVAIVKPINLQIGATALYDAELTARDNNTLTLSPWTGQSTFMSKKTDGSGNTNFIISTLEVQKLDGLGNISTFFGKVLTDEFNF